LFVAFRTFNLTLGRSPAVSRWLKKLLVRTLIRRRVRPAIAHERTIRVGGDRVTIVDRLELPADVRELQVAAQFSTIHMGSAGYVDARATRSSTQVQCFTRDDRTASLELRGVLDDSGSHWTMTS
jgi:hypothetical protein